MEKTVLRIKELREKPNDKPSWEEITDKMETSNESIKEVIEREKANQADYQQKIEKLRENLAHLGM